MACLCCPGLSYNCVITACYWLSLSLKAHIQLQIEIVAFCIRPIPRLMLFVSHHGSSLIPFYFECFFGVFLFVCFFLGIFFACRLIETLNPARLAWDLHVCIYKSNLTRKQHFCTLFNVLIQFTRYAAHCRFQSYLLTTMVTLRQKEFINRISFFLTHNEMANRTKHSNPKNTLCPWISCTY